MSESILLDKALCLPASDIAALLDGRVIAAIPKISVQRGWTFALHPCDLLIDSLSVEEQYHPFVTELAQRALAERQSATIEIKAWAKCELCTMVHDADRISVLSQSTIWTEKGLQEALKQRQYLFLTYLRVYRLAQPITVSTDAVSPDKFGKFLSLSALDLPKQFSVPLKVTESFPALSDPVFQKRKRQLENYQTPSSLKLEELQASLDSASLADPAARLLGAELRSLLGWSVEDIDQSDAEQEWIQTIADVGNSSDGNEFEKLARKSLIELGFKNSLNNPKASLDPNCVGGAGGLDVYCDYPYSLVGECKASKNESVSNGVSAQIINLGNSILGRNVFEQSIKIIFSAGSLTGAAEKAAIGNEINVMRPETLQRLVELKARYPGSINLLDLKSYLEKSPFGEESEAKIDKYIQQVWQKLKIRSHIIQSICKLAEIESNRTQFEVVEIRVQYNVMFASEDGKTLDNPTTHELLIELSSPLAGYVGRIQGTSLQSDRFYYLRDLPIE